MKENQNGGEEKRILKMIIKKTDTEKRLLYYRTRFGRILKEGQIWNFIFFKSEN